MPARKSAARANMHTPLPPARFHFTLAHSIGSPPSAAAFSAFCLLLPAYSMHAASVFTRLPACMPCLPCSSTSSICTSMPHMHYPGMHFAHTMLLFCTCLHAMHMPCRLFASFPCFYTALLFLHTPACLPSFLYSHYLSVVVTFLPNTCLPLYICS